MLKYGAADNNKQRAVWKPNEPALWNEPKYPSLLNTLFTVGLGDVSKTLDASRVFQRTMIEMALSQISSIVFHSTKLSVSNSLWVLFIWHTANASQTSPDLNIFCACRTGDMKQYGDSGSLRWAGEWEWRGVRWSNHLQKQHWIINLVVVWIF